MLSLFRGNGLYQSEHLLHVSHISRTHLSVSSTKFQLVTICNRFISLLLQQLLTSCRLDGKGGDNLSPPFREFRLAFPHLLDIVTRILAISQSLDYIHHTEEPILLFIIPHRAYFLLFKQLYRLFLYHIIITFFFSSYFASAIIPQPSAFYIIVWKTRKCYMPFIRHCFRHNL